MDEETKILDNEFKELLEASDRNSMLFSRDEPPRKKFESIGRVMGDAADNLTVLESRGKIAATAVKNELADLQERLMHGDIETASAFRDEVNRIYTLFSRKVAQA